MRILQITKQGTFNQLQPQGQNAHPKATVSLPVVYAVRRKTCEVLREKNAISENQNEENGES